jgi:hypothetical protein
MSRGHPRRRKKPRDSLQACLSLFLRPDRSAPHAATVLGASAVLEGGPPFQPYTCRDQLLSRGIGAYQMTAVARHALMKGAPESQPDLLLFLQEKYRRAIPVASQRTAAQSTSAVHSAAMTVTRHRLVYDNFSQRSPRPKCYYNNYASLSMSELLLPVAAATGTQPAVVIIMGAAQQREDRPVTFSGCDQPTLSRSSRNARRISLCRRGSASTK